MKGRNNKGQFKMTYSLNDWCLMNGHQDWLDLWDYELNGCGPEDVTYRSGKKYWFKCARGIHGGTYRCIANLTVNKNSILICKKCNSFGQYLLDTFGEFGICQYWSDRNTVDPFDIFAGNSKTKIWVRCQNNGHPDYLTTPNVFSIMGCRCPVCVNKKIIPGINDIATTRSDLASYFLYEEDTHKYAACSGKFVWMKCPVCGTVQFKQISNMYERGFSCDKCSRGKSYPEQFMYNVLDQIKQKHHIEIYSSHTFDWSKYVVANNDTLSGKKIYDFYVVFNKDIIIETHGSQHYEECWFTERTLAEEQENDKIKMCEAMRHGFCKDTYVVIDCRQSNKKYIQRSIMNSVLPKLFGFSENDIDWERADKQASINITQWICDLWNKCVEGNKVNTIAEVSGLSAQTVYKYLQNGAKLGLCKHGQNRNRPVYCIEYNCYFNCAKVCAEYLHNILNRNVSVLQINRSARSDGTMSAYGLHFKYISHDDFEEIYNIQTSMRLNEYNENNLKDLQRYIKNNY